jgi:hypothetical protein
VGDDSHSWAFDGWRILLWHELSADWGAKWTKNDVVGCAIDLDSRRMSFYLNGYGVEVGMGLAFSDFDVNGGLYPCASFNQKESIQFNFGSIPFKFGPPEGYRAFSDHVISTLEAARMTYIPYLKRPIGSVPGGQQSSPAEAASYEYITENILDDAMEETRGENYFSWRRRYFSPDDNGSGSGSGSGSGLGGGSRGASYRNTDMPTGHIPIQRFTDLKQQFQVDLAYIYADLLDLLHFVFFIH